MLGISWVDDGEVIFDKELDLKKIYKKNKIKLNSFSVFLLAMYDLDSLSNGKLELNKNGMDLLGFSSYKMIILLMLVVGSAFAGPLTESISKRNNLSRFRYAKSNSVLKDIFIIFICLGALFLPFLIL